MQQAAAFSRTLVSKWRCGGVARIESEAIRRTRCRDRDDAFANPTSLPAEKRQSAGAHAGQGSAHQRNASQPSSEARQDRDLAEAVGTTTSTWSSHIDHCAPPKPPTATQHDGRNCHGRLLSKMSTKTQVLSVAPAP